MLQFSRVLLPNQCEDSPVERIVRSLWGLQNPLTVIHSVVLRNHHWTAHNSHYKDNNHGNSIKSKCTIYNVSLGSLQSIDRVFWCIAHWQAEIHLPAPHPNGHPVPTFKYGAPIIGSDVSTRDINSVREAISESSLSVLKAHHPHKLWCGKFEHRVLWIASPVVSPSPHRDVSPTNGISRTSEYQDWFCWIMNKNFQTCGLKPLTFSFPHLVLGKQNNGDVFDIYGLQIRTAV